jgi:uncharacterized protein (TIGR02246 family)
MRSLVILMLLFLGSAPNASAQATPEVDAIRAELGRESAAWNRGDLAGYLSGYEKSPATIFVGKSEVLRGWDAIAAMYRKHYPDAKRMGTVTFSDLDIQLLGPAHALALGRWSLVRPAAEGGNIGGFFTLTLHKGKDGWRIIADHTS